MEESNKKINGINRELFIKLALCRAYEIEFNADEYHRMNNLDFSNDDNYCDLQDVVEDEELYKKIDEYADKIREFMNKFNGKTKKTWEMLKKFTENKNLDGLKAYVVTESIKNDEYYPYEYVSIIDGAFYWNNDYKKPFRLNSFYNPLEIEWIFRD